MLFFLTGLGENACFDFDKIDLTPNDNVSIRSNFSGSIESFVMNVTASLRASYQHNLECPSGNLDNQTKYVNDDFII